MTILQTQPFSTVASTTVPAADRVPTGETIFEWDPRKDATNATKHGGITFATFLSTLQETTSSNA